MSTPTDVHTETPNYPRSSCGCGYDLVLTPEGWQHDAAPYFWGDDHDPDPGEIDDAPPVKPLMQILHYRDPDSDCSLRVWIDGIEVTEFTVEDIDPGRGYEYESYQEMVADAKNPKDAFGEAIESVLTEGRRTFERYGLDAYKEENN
jgi:hypothetical protein